MSDLPPMTDTDRLDWLERQLRGRLDDGCDLTLRGIRSFPEAEAIAFAIAAAPAKFPAQTALSLRAAIDRASGRHQPTSPDE